MNERIRPQRETAGGGIGAAIFAGPDPVSQNILVTNGLYRETLPMANSSVGEIRRRLSERLDIDPQAQAVLDGTEVGDHVIVQPGQALMFMRRAGEKGWGKA